VILDLAWRNLWRRPRRTWLSVAGLAFATGFLIFMPSLQNGVYRAMINNTLHLFDGYAEIEQPGYRDEPEIRDTVKDVGRLLESVRAVAGENAVSARASAYVLLSSEGRSFGAEVVGVQPSTEARVSTVAKNVTTGRFLTDDDDGAIVLGATLARNLRVDVGDRVTLLGTDKDGSLAADALQVTGLFETGIADMDRLTAEIPLPRFQATFAMPDEAHTVVVTSENLGTFSPLLPRIRSVASPRGLEVLDWQTLQPGMWQAILLDASTATLIYLATVVVITFSLLNSLLMSVLERTKELGMLLALGMRPGQIGRMVFVETVLLLLIGLGIGLLLGVVLTSHFGRTGIVFGQAQQIFAEFGLSGALHPKLSALTLLAGPAVIALGTLVAGFFPFWRVYRLHPIAAMKAA
jgi:putative ABC transport system permease protein